jgi:S1-C subfamily serine protease
VTRRSPAAAAGIRPGDVLVRAGERQLETVEDFSGVLRGRIAGESLQIGLGRDRSQQNLTVRLGEGAAP